MAEAPLVVAVAGAAGFVGRALCHALAREAGVIALSRRPECAGADAAEPGVTWRYADLFSLLQTENALQGADVAVYLVHSMLPHARLTQGAFEDVDFILADNFARAARRAGVKKILFLGGIIPKGERLSRHLASRLEVERVLASHGVPVVTARAGLIVGADGSSFRILERLVRRLPLMLCPAWTVTRGQPIYLDDVVAVLVRAALDPELPAGAYDLAGTDRLTYREMLEHTAEALGKRPKLINVPFFSPKVSRLWLSLVTGAPRALVYPLVQSLHHDLSSDDDRLARRYGIVPRPFDVALRDALVARPAPLRVSGSHGARPPAGDDAIACSIQRLPLPKGASIAWVVRQYADWLPRAASPLLRVATSADGHLDFFALGVRVLELHFSPERSTANRQMFYVEGGRLCDRAACPDRARGRFEFRAVPGRDEVVAALFDFRPSLPWWVYGLTQARVHLWVMRAFGRHLRRIAAGLARPAMPRRKGRFATRP